MAERSNAAVSKTVVLARVPRVRIPLSPQNKISLTYVGVSFKRSVASLLAKAKMKKENTLRDDFVLSLPSKGKPKAIPLSAFGHRSMKRWIFLPFCKVEKTLFADPYIFYPLYTDRERAASLEDCGRVPGFQVLLKSKGKKNHPKYDQFLVRGRNSRWGNLTWLR
jgi:hypothetical protein